MEKKGTLVLVYGEEGPDWQTAFDVKNYSSAWELARAHQLHSEHGHLIRSASFIARGEGYEGYSVIVDGQLV